MNQDLINYLSQFITSERLKKFDRVLQNRTRYLTIILEDLFQPHNASAVLRTCECLGIQDVYIIENKNKYSINPDIVLGATNWLNLYQFSSDKNNTVSAINNLKKKGYRIVATTLNQKAGSLDDFNLEKGKSAILFGTELTGLSDIALSLADEQLIIPISGFTNSYNISVSAGIILYYITRQLKNSAIDWKLSKSEMDEIKLNWLRTSIKKSTLIEKQFLKKVHNQ